MASAKQKELVAARRQKVKDYIECHPGELITSGSVAIKFGVTSATIKEDMRQVGPTLGGVFEAIPRRGYRWTPTRKQEMSNHEGYSDPTAAVAIKNTDESAYIPFAEGSVHEAQRSDGCYEPIVIVSSFSGFSYILIAHPVKEKSNAESNELYTFFDYEEMKYYVDHRRLSSKPNKYIGRKLFDLGDETIDHIQKSIASLVDKDVQEVTNEINRQCDLEEQLRLEKWEDQLAHRAVQLDNLQHDLETQKAEFEAEKKRIKDIDQSFDNREALLDQREVDLRKREEEFEKSSAHVCIDEIDEWAAMVEENLNAREADLRQREAELDQALEMAELKVKVEVYEKILFPKSLKERILDHSKIDYSKPHGLPAFFDYKYDPDSERMNKELAEAILSGDGKEAPRTYKYNPKTDKENEELAKNILFNGPVNDVDEKYDATFFDPTTGSCFRSSLDKIKSAEAKITKQLTDLGYDDDNPWYADPAAVKLVHEKYDEFFNRIAKEARV